MRIFHFGSGAGAGGVVVAALTIKTPQHVYWGSCARNLYKELDLDLPRSSDRREFQRYRTEPGRFTQAGRIHRANAWRDRDFPVTSDGGVLLPSAVRGCVGRTEGRGPMAKLNDRPGRHLFRFRNWNDGKGRLLDGLGYVVSQIVGCTKVTSEESDIAPDRAFQNDPPLLRAEFAEDLQLGGADETCDRPLGFTSGCVALNCSFEDQEIVNAVGVAVTVPEHTFVPLRLGQLLQQIFISSDCEVGTDVHVARLNGVDLQIPLYDRWVISGEELGRMYP